MKLKKIFLFAIFFVGIFFSSCGDEVTEKKSVPLVKVEQVKFSSPSNEGSYSGTLKGRYETNLSFQVGGKIISRNVQVGEKVSAGQILMKIDPKDVIEQNRNADSQVQSAIAQLNLAKTNLERYFELFKQNAVAEATLDQYKTQYDSALANYNAAVATAVQSKNSLGYTNLIANAAGVISAINSEVGQVVAAGQTVLTLVQTDELETEINVPENYLSKVTEGKVVTVKFWALPDEVQGVVREISPMADSNSRTYRVRISLPNVSEKIQLGMTSSVTFTDDSKNVSNVSTLPLSAIYQTGNQTQVWTVENGEVKLKNISVNQFGDNEVVVSGLNNGEIVVTAGVHKLREGQKVRVEEKAE